MPGDGFPYPVNRPGNFVAEPSMSDEDMYVVPYVPEDETFTAVDWKASPYEVLERVSGLLREHGLVVLLADSNSDEYPFKIGTR